jgi:hypothetical protein
VVETNTSGNLTGSGSFVAVQTATYNALNLPTRANAANGTYKVFTYGNALARPATIPRTRFAETEQKAISYHCGQLAETGAYLLMRKNLSRQPSSHPAIQPSSYSTIQPCHHATIQPFNHATIQPFNHPTMQPFNHSTIQPFPRFLLDASTKFFDLLN